MFNQFHVDLHSQFMLKPIRLNIHRKVAVMTCANDCLL